MKPSGYMIWGILSVVLITSCDKDDSYSPGITGVWIWEKSISGWGTFTPESTGQQRFLKISQDLYREYVNDSLVLESEYEIIPKDDRFYGSPQVLEVTHGDSYILTISKTSLILDLSYNPDASTHYYRRP